MLSKTKLGYFSFFLILFSIAIYVLLPSALPKTIPADSKIDVQIGPRWPLEVTAVKYPSSADNTLQPAIFYAPNTTDSVPLLVALHTWTGDYRQALNAPLAKWCIENNWAFIHPNFRGPNNKFEAIGSDLVIQDILSAVKFAKNYANIDTHNIYLVGASGGGHAALMVAATHPNIWAGVSVWVPITDLTVWYQETQTLDGQYRIFLEQALGGAPGTSPTIDLEYKTRSPLTYLSPTTHLNIDINTGIHDGHNGPVPISHSLLAYNALVTPEDQISPNDIKYFVEQEKVPQHLIDPLLSDPSYGEKSPIFRTQSGTTRLTIFEGGHEIIINAVTSWLTQNIK